MLNYNLKATGLDCSDEIRSYVEKRLEHAEKFLANDPTAHVDVELQYLPEGRSGKYRTEFTVASAGQVYRAERWGEALHESIDLAIGELQSELSRSKKKAPPQPTPQRAASQRVPAGLAKQVII